MDNDNDALGMLVGDGNALIAEGIVFIVGFLGAAVYMNVHAILNSW